MPVQFDGRRGKKEWTGKIVDVQAGSGHGLPSSKLGEFVGQRACALVAGRKKVDRPGDGCRQVICRKAGDRVDARTTCGQCRPIVLDALAERGDETNTSNGYNGPAEVIRVAGHDGCLRITP